MSEAKVKDLKEQMLDRYAEKSPRMFYQWDVFSNSLFEEYHEPDADGDMLTHGRTVELMRGSTVRVLIPVDASPLDAVRGLRKVIDWIERDMINFWSTKMADRFGPPTNIDGKQS